MDIEYDPEKDAANRAKHNISLEVGLEYLENRVGEIDDDRRDYGEVRVNAFGMVGGHLHVCTYTMRGETYRLISVRKANRQEQRRWLT